MHFWTEDVGPPVDRGREADEAEARTMAAALFKGVSAANTQAPVPMSEPPIGTVLTFQVAHPGAAGRQYTYAALRAGDGRWYLTSRTEQGVGWETMVRAVRERLVGPLVIMRPDRSVFL